MVTQLQLEIIDPAGQVRFVPLAPEGLTTIGSHPDNQVVVADAGVASFQAELDHRLRPWRIRRLANRGQISVSGQPLPVSGSVTLAEGCLIQLGGYLLILLEGASPPVWGTTDLSVPESSSDTGLKVERLNVDSREDPSGGYRGPVGQHSEIAGSERLKRPDWTRWRERLTVPCRSNLVSVIGPALVWLAGLGLVLGSILFSWLTVSRLQAESQATQRAEAETFKELYFQPPVVAPDFGENRVPAHRPDDSGIQAEISYEEMFQEAALMYGLDWRLLAELAYQESRMNALALGKDNDMGLMQIIPSTWQEWAPQVGVSDPFDPYSNVLVGAAYLAYVRDYCQTKGRPEIYWMVVGYNWGPDNLRHLFEQNGDWAQVPSRQRRYALEILQAVSDNSVRWKE